MKVLAITKKNIIKSILGSSLSLVTLVTIFVSSMLLLSDEAFPADKSGVVAVEMDATDTVMARPFLVKDASARIDVVNKIRPGKETPSVTPTIVPPTIPNIIEFDADITPTSGTTDAVTRIDAKQQATGIRLVPGRRGTPKPIDPTVVPVTPTPPAGQSPLGSLQRFNAYMQFIDSNGDRLISASEMRDFYAFLQRIVNAGYGNSLISFNIASRILLNKSLFDKAFLTAAKINGNPLDATYRQMAGVFCRFGSAALCPFIRPGNGGGNPTTPVANVIFLETDIEDQITKIEVAKMSAADEAFIREDYQGKGDEDLDLASADAPASTVEITTSGIRAIETAELGVDDYNNMSLEELAGIAPAAGPTAPAPVTTPTIGANVNGGMDYLRSGAL